MTFRVGPFFLGPPTPEERQAVVASCSRRAFNFPHVRVTRDAPPLPEEVQREGWTLDWHRVQIGKGRKAYDRAQQLLKRWEHFDLGWASVNPAPVKPGAAVVVTARSLFVWSCNPLRISFVEEGPASLPPPPQQQPSSTIPSSNSAASAWLQLGGSGKRRGRRFAFAHTTLEGHQISGEERFAVSWDRGGDDSVWYEIYTLSRPATPLVALMRPLLRHYQRRFTAESMAAVQQRMAEGGGQKSK